MANFLNNCLIQLFDIIEEECNIKFVTFTDSQVAGNTETNKISHIVEATEYEKQGDVTTIVRKISVD